MVAPGVPVSVNFASFARHARFLSACPSPAFAPCTALHRRPHLPVHLCALSAPSYKAFSQPICGLPLSSPRKLSSLPLRTSGTAQDAHYMRAALVLARAAFDAGEVPIGAVLVDACGAIISRGRNRVEASADPTAHAEMEALRGAPETGSRWRRNDCTLYSTVEPCAMCYSAAALARVRRVVYGAPDFRLGACGTWIDLADVKHPFHNMEEVAAGVCEEEARDLLKLFFRERRKRPDFQVK